jgi:UDP-N-acetylmuramoyl-tripeptide--D-alanyl-D-alanine ligase
VAVLAVLISQNLILLPIEFLNIKYYMFYLTQLVEIIDLNLLEVPNEILVTGVSTDTRLVMTDNIFIALRGGNFDGHNFLELAVAKGAIALIVEEKISLNISSSIPQFVVKNTYHAYQKIAQWWRRQLAIPVVGITGSVGKTTTKELVAAVCATKGKVQKTQLNYNNEIGVPKTLLSLSRDDDYAIVEMGMRAPGEIALLTEIANPDIGIITNVGTAHIGRLGSLEAIAKAKCELLANMDSHHGIAILNQDNPLLIDSAKQVWSGQTITYGLEGGDLFGKLIDSSTMRLDGQDFLLPLPGRHNALNYLAALAVAKILGIEWSTLAKGIELDLPEGRAQRYLLENDILLLDETYNAGLESMYAALELLKETNGRRHIAVLGAMKEQGDYTEQLHEQVGQKAKKLGVDKLFVLTSDPEAEYILKGAQGIELVNCPNKENLLLALKNSICRGDRILFKASHSVGLSQIVRQLRNES